VLSIAQATLFETEDEDPAGVSEEWLRQAIRRELQAHLLDIGLLGPPATAVCADTETAKERIRLSHAMQRKQLLERESRFLSKYGRLLLNKHFAHGSEVAPPRIDPVLCPVSAETEDSAVFRLATLLWSVPVSYGYGRRMRYLVRDRANGKLIGLFGLADPVYNLRARDNWIGWTVQDRRARLVNLMDAHVVGSVPPYNRLLGGKLVAALMTSAEVCQAFSEKYNTTTGIISGQQKRAQLVMITVTSALGRSSMYNRLRLVPLVEFRKVGKTEGWGHFQVPDSVFSKMRQLLTLQGHRYASGHKYGMGPNWRIRVVREALAQVGLPENILRHGIAREIYAAPLAENWREFLKGQMPTCTPVRPSAADISATALQRWVLPRAIRQPEYECWTREDTWAALTLTSERDERVP
jgi:hypothetical protein